MTKYNLCDYHIHTRYSSDSCEEPEAIIRRAIELGLDEICFTDHMDYDYPVTPDYDNPAFVFDIAAYYKELSALREKYRGQLTIKIGMELGLMPYLAGRNAETAASADFDFIIGSTHLVDGHDPYYPDFWAGKNADNQISRYLEFTYENVRSFSNYDVYGHLDYITRYVPDKSYRFEYARHSDVVDAILKEIIHSGHGIELNTSPLCKGLPYPNPCPDILKRYRELGGEIITIGSDAHTAGNVGGHFDAAKELLISCGFKYHSVFTGRKIAMKEL
ncbi:MAG: histidinol-phosphatase HisJ family protein [Lachnospiraceae bacterium]